MFGSRASISTCYLLQSQCNASKADVGFGALLEDLWLFSFGFVSCVLVVFWKMVQLFGH